MRPILRAGAMALAASLAIGACGGDDESRFATRTDAVRAAVAAGDVETARAELEQLAVEAFMARDEGAIDDEELAELASLIATAEDQVDALAGVEETTTTAAPTTTSPPTTEVVEEEEEEEDDDDKPGRGNKKKNDD